MSKSLIALIGLVALLGSAAYAAEPAKRRLNTVTFTQTVSTSNASLRAAKKVGVALGSWAKVDGLDTSWDVAEHRPLAKTLTFTLSTTNPAPPPAERTFRSRAGHLMAASTGAGNEVAVESLTIVHESVQRVK